MSFNIVDLVKDQVKGQMIGHMGNLLGDEGGKATGAVDSIIPALLNGLTGAASSDEGAGKLFGAIQDQDDSLIDNMGSLLSGGQASSVIENGNSILSSLFGNGGLGKLAGALSTFSGVSKGGTSSLMGMLAPILLGVLKRKVMGEGLNAGGVASLLSSQSSNINAALPQGLTDQLSSSGFLSSISGAGAGIATGAAGAVAAGAASVTGGARDAVNVATDAVSGAADSARDGVANATAAVGNAKDGVTSAVSGAADSARDGAANVAGAVSDTAEKGGSMFRWLLPLLILAGLAWAAYTYLLPGAKDAAGDAAGKLGDGAAAVTESATDAAATATDAVKDTATAAVEATTEAASNATDAVSDAAATATDAASSAIDLPISPEEVGNKLTGLFSTATDTIGGITDVESANAALPALADIGENIDSVSDMFGKVPAEARGPFNTIAAEGVGKLKPVIDKVMEIPGVGAIVGPILEPILEKLQEFGG